MPYPDSRLYPGVQWLPLGTRLSCGRTLVKMLDELHRFLRCRSAFFLCKTSLSLCLFLLLGVPEPASFVFHAKHCTTITTTAWQSSPPRWQGYALTYTVFASGTAAWLTRWTAPLLRANPVSWVLLYALGHSDPAAAAARAGQHILQSGAAAAEGGDTGWGGAVVGYVSGAAGWVRSELGGVTTARDSVASGEGTAGSRPLLVVGWAAALAVGVPLFPRLSRRLALSKTASRKLFHALATAMFLPAIALEREFLALALGAALGVLLAAEFLRCAGCPPLAAALDRYYGEFLDARDGGCVVVTHLFLLLGCALPVWLCG